MLEDLACVERYAWFVDASRQLTLAKGVYAGTIEAEGLSAHARFFVP